MTSVISREAIDRYTKTVGMHKLLSPEEERSLLEQVAQGDKRAKDKLVQHNLRLVVFVVRKYLNAAGTLEIDDLIQEGTIGLQTAIERFDISRGKLSTYAVWWIRQGITRAIQSGSRTVRLPSHRYESAQAVRKTAATLYQELGRKATAAEIAAALGKDTGWVTDRLASMRPIASLDCQLPSSNHKSEGDEGSLSDLVGTAGDLWETAIDREEREQLELWLSHIPERYATAVKARYGLGGNEPQSLESLGKTMGVSKTAASSFVSRGVKLLHQEATKANRPRKPLPVPPPMNASEANCRKVLAAIEQAEQAAIADGSYQLPSRNKLAIDAGQEDYFYRKTSYSERAVAAFNQAEARLAGQKAEGRRQEVVQTPPTLLALPSSLLSSPHTLHPTPNQYQQRLEAEIARLQAENEALRSQTPKEDVHDDRILLQALKEQDKQLRVEAAGLLDQIGGLQNQISDLEQKRKSLLSKAELIQELVEQQEASAIVNTSTNGHSKTPALAGVVS